MEELQLPLVPKKKKKIKPNKQPSKKRPKLQAKVGEKLPSKTAVKPQMGLKDVAESKLVTAEARVVTDPEPTALEPDVMAQPQTDRGTLEPEVSARVEELPHLDLSQDQIDRIHRGRKTTVLTRARKELDWGVGDRVRLPDGTILKILRKEKITLGINMPEDLVESEGFSAENRAEFIRHLQRLGLRANDTAFIYRIELSD